MAEWIYGCECADGLCAAPLTSEQYDAAVVKRLEMAEPDDVFIVRPDHATTEVLAEGEGWVLERAGKGEKR